MEDAESSEDQTEGGSLPSSMRRACLRSPRRMCDPRLRY